MFPFPSLLGGGSGGFWKRIAEGELAMVTAYSPFLFVRFGINHICSQESFEETLEHLGNYKKFFSFAIINTNAINLLSLTEPRFRNKFGMTHFFLSC
jgi:hypothetical protein